MALPRDAFPDLIQAVQRSSRMYGCKVGRWYFSDEASA